MSFIVSEHALADLEDIWEYSSRSWGAEHANLYIDLIVLRFAWLAEHRGLWRRRQDLADGLFNWTEKSHVIYFSERANRIEIVRVLHGSMDPRSNLV